jgi:predicted dehydrogenase
LRKKINFGIIGTGFIAPFHAEAISQATGFARLVAVAGTNKSTAGAFARKYGVKTVYSDYRKLLAQQLIDAVVICTPHSLHAPMTLEAFESGKHVLVEKPMAVNLKEADKMIASSKEKNLKLAVGFQSRFNKYVIDLKKALSEGKFGRIVTVSATLRWYRPADYFLQKKWRGKSMTAGGGVLINQAIHLIDLMQYFLGQPESVFCMSETLTHDIEVEDVSASILKFQNDSLGLIEATTSVRPKQAPSLVICGGEGLAFLKFDTSKSWQTEILLENKVNGEDRQRKIIHQTTPMKEFISQIKDFVHTILKDKKPQVNGEEGRKSLEIVRALYCSSVTKRIVEFPFKENNQVSR